MRRLLLAALVWTAFWPGVAGAVDCDAPRARVATVIGLSFCVDAAFETAIAGQVKAVRADIAARRQAGKLVAYPVGPLFPGEGGDERVDREIAASVKARLERRFGETLWVLDPEAYRLPPRGEHTSGPEEHVLLWTRVLAGEDGLGRDVDLAHFTGPGDARAYFGCGDADLVGCLARWMSARADRDDAFRKEIFADAGRQGAFLRHYALRASSAYEKGAHDLWNLFARVNRRRPLGDQIAIYFDGRPVSPAEMETQVSPGYDLR